MRILMILLLLIHASPSFSVSLNHHTIDDKQELIKQLDQAAENDFPVFIYVYAYWCYVCEYMDDDVFSKDIIKRSLNKSYLNLFINITKMTQEKDKALSELGAYGTPTYVFFDKNGKKVHQQSGYIPLNDMKKLINKHKD